MTYEIKIVFKDKSAIYLKNVANYKINKEVGCLMVEINGYHQFFNMEEIRYYGRKYDLENEQDK